MSSTLKAEAESRLQASLNQATSPTHLSLLKLFTLIPTNKESIFALEQCLESRECQLGDELLSYPGSDAAKYSGESKPKNRALHLVCQGRVRLLCFDPRRRRDVSVQVLETGDPLGADHFFCHHPLAYRAIAASDGQIALLTYTELEHWLQQIPELRPILQQQTLQRQYLMFFRTATSLRLFPSHKLQQLTPYLVEQRVRTGEFLARTTLAQVGRYWLRSGQVQAQQNQFPPPTIGSSWGYPEAIPADWTAQTELSVYRLPTEHWKTFCALIPTLASGAPQPLDPETAIQPNRDGSRGAGNDGREAGQLTPMTGSSQSPAIRQANGQQGASASNPFPPIHQPESAPIAFPQPQRQRYQQRQFWRGYPFIQQQSTADCGGRLLSHDWAVLGSPIQPQ